jgi:hypothetical protein
MTIGECDSTTPVQITRSRGESAHVFNSWRRFRRAAHEALTTRAVQNYHPIQIKEATILVSSLLTPSTNLKQDRHFKRLAASTIMSIVYDYPTIMSDHDHVVEKIERYNDRTSRAAGMGAYFVDIFPWMKHIPERSWFPSSRCLLVKTYGLAKPDSRNGSGKAYGHLQRTLKCSLAFSIVSKLTLYVLVLAVVSGAQLTDGKKTNGGDRPSFCASLIHNPDRGSLSEIEMSFLAGLL